MEKSPIVEPSPPSVEKVPDVEGGTKTDDVGRPVIPVGGKVLCVGRGGGRLVFPLPFPELLSKPLINYELIKQLRTSIL